MNKFMESWLVEIPANSPPFPSFLKGGALLEDQKLTEH